MESLIVIIGALVLLAVVLVVMRKLQRRRRLSRLAGRLRLRFSGDDSLGICRRLAGAYLLQRCHGGRAVNILHGRLRKLSVWLFDYQYESGSGAERRLHEQTMLVCQPTWRHESNQPHIVALLPQSPEPTGLLRRSRPFSTGHDQLDRQCRCYSDAPEQARHVLSQSLREHLLHCGPVEWELTDGFVLMSCPTIISELRLTRLLGRAIQVSAQWFGKS